jgi:hypothetical protein
MNRRVVAQGSFTLVEQCDCGAMYLTIGPVCMKLDVRALPELRETLARAASGLQGEDGAISTAPAASGGGSREGETEGEGGADPSGAGGPSCDVN